MADSAADDAHQGEHDNASKQSAATKDEDDDSDGGNDDDLERKKHSVTDKPDVESQEVVAVSTKTPATGSEVTQNAESGIASLQAEVTGCKSRVDNADANDEHESRVKPEVSSSAAEDPKGALVQERNKQLFMKSSDVEEDLGAIARSTLLDVEPVSSDDGILDMEEDVERQRRHNDEGKKIETKDEPVDESDVVSSVDEKTTELVAATDGPPDTVQAEIMDVRLADIPSADDSSSENVDDIELSEDHVKLLPVQCELREDCVDEGSAEEERKDLNSESSSEQINQDADTKEEVVDVKVDGDVQQETEESGGVRVQLQSKEVPGSSPVEDDSNKDSKDVEPLSCLEILDVRTISEEDKSMPSSDKAEEAQEIHVSCRDDNAEKKNKNEVDSKSVEGPFETNVESSVAEVEKKTISETEDADIKSYAADAMNELLGMFGYDKVDDNVKDSLTSTVKAGDGDEDKGETDDKKMETDEEAAEGPIAGDNGGPSGDSAAKSVVMATKSTTPVVGRQCSVCGKTKACKYQVLMLGMTKFLCDDVCFKEFRTKQKISMATAATTASVKELAVLAQEMTPNRPVTRSITHPKDVCNQCKKEIRNGQGLLPGVGENKPLCSEECMRAYQATQGLKRACAQCGGHILGRSRCLTWEAMEYCNEECLGKYQSFMGSQCAFCQQAVQQTSLGKYCVRFGSDIKQFCSNGCLEEFKKGLKICSYCQKDISTGSEGFLAPVGDKGQFKEFCSQACMEKFETMGNPTPIRPSIQACSVCSKVTSVKVEVTFENKIHRLCSEPCIAAFRYANKINTSICDTCHKFFDLDVDRQLSIQFEGTCKRFCTKACTNVFVLHHRKVVPCSWCKVKKYNFDMIERVDSNNHVQLFCSLNCLSLFRVSLNATSSRRVQCDYCHQSKPAQYHLTMSDASIRNFCSYPCVMQFQSQFTTVAPAPPTTLTATTTAASASSTQVSSSLNAADSSSADADANGQSGSTDQSGTPIISSVMSLAPSQAGTQACTVNRSVVLKPVISAASLAAANAPKSLKTAQTQTLYPAISQHVIIKQPPVKMLKNKTISCKPTVQTKGVSCKPHPCHKLVQTDGVQEKQLFVPIPVPIYVPVPMHMYTTPVPFPIAFPVPIPVPIFIPTTKNSAQGIFRQIKEIQEKIPDNPFEADLILMAEMVAEDGSAAVTSKKDKLATSRRTRSLDRAEAPSDMNQSELTAEADAEVSRGTFDDEVESQLRESCQTSNSFGEDVLQMALQMASGMEGELETALTTTSSNGGNESNSRDSAAVTATADENGSFLTSKSDLKTSSRGGGQKRTRGGGGGGAGGGSRGGRARKRARFESDAAREGSPTHDAERSANLPHPPPPYSYGVNAWKHWVLQKNTQLELAGGGGGKGTGSPRARRLKLFKTDLLQLTADELNYSLCLFVKEVRKPDGGEYAADSIYYLCLGLQQYLFESGRVDNIFADVYYEKFTECLNEVLISYEVALVSHGVFLSRIEEEILWDCKQLGAHSPHVLLNTLMYFNTKYFMLKTVDDHTQLSFSHILKHWKKGPGGGSSSANKQAQKGVSGNPGRSALLRYYPPSQNKDSTRRRKEVVPSYEQVENLDNPLRCPVKLYEFYLSKCPESIKNRSDVFYLYPERSCVPDSPVWYSTMSLGKDTITKMLQRIKMVREVGETMMMLS